MIRGSTALLALCAVLLGACETPRPLEDIKPGERPDIETDEAGLWMQMDKLEGRLRTSGRIVTDQALNDYLHEVTCRIDAEYCKDLRLYIVQTPHFNASMAPNGTMQVWTGLLLRVENEAQLAFVLGHEMGHYIRRHSVRRWRDIRGKSGFATFLSVTTAAAGVGYIGNLAQLATLSSIMAFSRDQERESDDIGFEMTTRAGYDPAQAPKVWSNLLAERDAAGKDKPSVFFASHPAGEERTETLKRAAEEFGPGGRVGREDFLAATLPLRRGWLRDEIRKRDFGSTEFILDSLLAAAENPGEIFFFKGEMYRLRGDEGDLDLALSAYRTAAADKEAPPETHRSLGLIYWKKAKRSDARAAFEEYLLRSPDATDRAMVESYLTQLQ